MRFIAIRTVASGAEDLTQETFASAWKGIMQFEGRAPLRIWLHRIAYNKVLDSIRTADRAPVTAGQFQTERADEQSAEDPLRRLMAGEWAWRLRAAKVARLAERISLVEEMLEIRRLGLTPDTYSQDFQVRTLQERKAMLEAQYEADRAKLDADLALKATQMANLPRLHDDERKIEQLEKSASQLRALRQGQEIYRNRYLAGRHRLEDGATRAAAGWPGLPRHS